MTKKKTKADKEAARIFKEQETEYELARMESVIHGVAFLMITPDAGIKHLPLDVIAKGEPFGRLQKNSI